MDDQFENFTPEEREKFIRFIQTGVGIQSMDDKQLLEHCKADSKDIRYCDNVLGEYHLFDSPVEENPEFAHQACSVEIVPTGARWKPGVAMRLVSGSYCVFTPVLTPVEFRRFAQAVFATAHSVDRLVELGHWLRSD